MGRWTTQSSVPQAGQSGLVVVLAAMGDKPFSPSSPEIVADRSGSLAAVLWPLTMVCPLQGDSPGCGSKLPLNETIPR